MKLNKVAFHPKQLCDGRSETLGVAMSIGTACCMPNLSLFSNYTHHKISILTRVMQDIDIWSEEGTIYFTGKLCVCSPQAACLYLGRLIPAASAYRCCGTKAASVFLLPCRFGGHSAGAQCAGVLRHHVVVPAVVAAGARHLTSKRPPYHHNCDVPDKTPSCGRVSLCGTVSTCLASAGSTSDAGHCV